VRVYVCVCVFVFVCASVSPDQYSSKYHAHGVQVARRCLKLVSTFGVQGACWLVYNASPSGPMEVTANEAMARLFVDSDEALGQMVQTGLNPKYTWIRFVCRLFRVLCGMCMRVCLIVCMCVYVCVCARRLFDEEGQEMMVGAMATLAVQKDAHVRQDFVANVRVCLRVRMLLRAMHARLLEHTVALCTSVVRQSLRVTHAHGEDEGLPPPVFPPPPPFACIMTYLKGL
jgi:hypothetical protein